MNGDEIAEKLLDEDACLKICQVLVRGRPFSYIADIWERESTIRISVNRPTRREVVQSAYRQWLQFGSMFTEAQRETT